MGYLELRYVLSDVGRVHLRRHHLMEVLIISMPDRHKELGDGVLKIFRTITLFFEYRLLQIVNFVNLNIFNLINTRV